MNSQSPGPGTRRPTARNSREQTSPSRLPDQRELVAAFTAADDPQTDRPLLIWATTLAHLHRRRHSDPLSAAGIDCRRAEIVAAIDRWVHDQAAERARRPRRDSLGATIDRMAAAHVHANHVLHHSERVSDDRVHAAWYRLALLADEWADLVIGAEPVRRRA